MKYWTDRTFRNAWDLDSSKNLVVDMAKAKALHMDRIRLMRNAELEKLDKEQFKNLTDQNALVRIESEKQVLRDIPQNFDLDAA